MSRYDDWKAREPDRSQCYAVGIYDSRAEAEQVADENFSDKHVEFTRRGSRVVLWVWE